MEWSVQFVVQAWLKTESPKIVLDLAAAYVWEAALVFAALLTIGDENAFKK